MRNLIKNIFVISFCFKDTLNFLCAICQQNEPRKLNLAKQYLIVKIKGNFANFYTKEKEQNGKNIFSVFFSYLCG